MLAFDNGDINAIYNVGLYYENIEKDKAKALGCYLMANSNKY
jgi:hypothetical protein